MQLMIDVSSIKSFITWTKILFDIKIKLRNPELTNSVLYSLRGGEVGLDIDSTHKLCDVSQAGCVLGFCSFDELIIKFLFSE